MTETRLEDQPESVSISWPGKQVETFCNPQEYGMKKWSPFPQPIKKLKIIPEIVIFICVKSYFQSSNYFNPATGYQFDSSCPRNVQLGTRCPANAEFSLLNK
ncbi:Hypothetical predicted protein [Paramuricea clavata]|uniref:Uncharacterized protein n=1 Tax=Paramuricea clavata TaxID=317549 RepID=A0A7D9DAW5_PARCT|nr:Hypothetical predicted protein [Paramuricea clavata]